MTRLVRSILLFALCFAGFAFAGSQNFEKTAFDALQKAGKPTLVVIHADWCPTCKAQDPVVSELLGSPDYRGISAFRVDFDKQKDVVRTLKASSQSTLIVFKGGKEVGRSVGDTRKDSIAALLKKAI